MEAGTIKFLPEGVSSGVEAAMRAAIEAKLHTLQPWKVRPLCALLHVVPS